MSTDSGSDTARSQGNVNTRPRQKAKMAERVKYPDGAVNLKIPPFWPEKPSIWFAQVEGQFAIANVLDSTTKFYHIVARRVLKCHQSLVLIFVFKSYTSRCNNGCD